jgi:drug/metabolite transporter (DMT)-like permease
MVAVIFGFSGALVFGCADFLGGLSAKRISPYLVSGIVGLTGFIGLFIVSAIVGGTISFEAVFWGALSGICGTIAIMMLYAALAIGPMSILSPLGALVSAAVPVTWALSTGESLPLLGYIALAVGLIAIVLVGFVPEKNAIRPAVKGVLLAVGSGVGIGFFMICIDRTPTDSQLIPLVANRLVSTLVMFSILSVMMLVRNRRGQQARAATATATATARKLLLPPLPSPTVQVGLWMAVAAGIVDATANALLILGLESGELSVMSVLTAMYPAGTVILAAVILKERVAPWQGIGLVLAIVSAGCLALG